MSGGTLQTVDQALALLEYLATCQGQRTLTQLASEFGLPKATMHRLLATLKARGYVVQDPETARYSFGTMCIRLAHEGRLGGSVSEACMPAMRSLWQATEETVLFAVHHAGQAVIVEKLDSPRPVVATSSLGFLLPLHAVSEGKVLLASRPDEEVERFIAAGLEAHTRATCVDPVRLWGELRRVRRTGYAVNREGFRPGVSGVSAPVRWSGSGAVAAAMGVCVPSSRFNRQFQFLLKQVLAAAASATGAVGAAVATLGRTEAAA